MKIAHIAPPWITIPPKNYGGTENVIYNIVEEQVAQGHDVTLFAPGDARTSARLISFFSRSLLESGVPWQAHLKAYFHTYKAIEYLKNHQFDIVHTHLSSSADMYTFPLASQLSIPMVTTLHSRFPFDRVQEWTGDADDFYMEWIKSVPMIAISESAKAEVTYPLHFVGTVPHGLPMHEFKPTTLHPENYLAWMGRFVPEKGAHTAIEVARATGLPLILAGTIDRHIPVSIEYFEREIKPSIDGRQIKYIGPVNMQEKIALLSGARAFLNPITWEEPFGMVILEAMAVGCPVISFARGAAPEVLAHGESGFLVRDKQEMIRALAQIDRLDRRTIRDYVDRNFSAQSMVKKYSEIYQRVRTAHLLKTVRMKRSVADTITSTIPIITTTRPLASNSEAVTGNYSVPSVSRTPQRPQISYEVDQKSIRQ
ncbi:glycosyltransferase family 4 protein [Dictyobacter arantiisoli]|uniref:Glycosyl transferase n=1 Tax=Dictyobacter arantiisoli TaxID=2014874 RepID=A0A5A5TKQ9_9CHLR|nr:glycosyltransferase family 4 protein [Dictyobacter arantiisoli]GCF11633.1 glycosyl transferase [Dictyobacter arantiisoli]